MRKIGLILTFILCFAGLGKASAVNFTDESLNYVISYKWGLIHKDSGEATLKLQNKGDKYKVTLVGKTKSWADKFYQVRDTLLCTILKDGLKPVSYSKIAHEGGTYSRDDITYAYNGSSIGGHSKMVRVNKKGETRNKEKQFEATGPTYDMLSVFYYLRTIDYSQLVSGKSITATLFSGTQVEKLTIRCEGKEKLKLRNKTEREAYHIKFRFTRDGQKKSSEDIDAWISTDSQHIPLQITGSLPLGQVRCYYIG